MSLDGFVAQPDENPAELFDWYWNGEVVVPSAQASMSFSVDAASAPMLQKLTSGCGAIVAGRRLFDQTDGWGDNHPAASPPLSRATLSRRLQQSRSRRHTTPPDGNGHSHLLAGEGKP
jgi:hypothetical protein